MTFESQKNKNKKSAYLEKLTKMINNYLYNVAI